MARDSKVSTGGKDLNMLLAVGRKRLADAHFTHAMELIEHGAPHVSPPRALDIYSRLHHLTEEEFRTLKNRVLVAYAKRAPTDEKLATFIGINGDVDWDITATVFQKIRKRLKGRQNLELRRWVELHTGRAEAELLTIHAENVIRLYASLGDLSPVLDAVRLYMETLGLRNTLHEALYITVCNRLFQEHAAGAVSLPARRAQVIRDSVQKSRTRRAPKNQEQKGDDAVVALGYE